MLGFKSRPTFLRFLQSVNSFKASFPEKRFEQNFAYSVFNENAAGLAHRGAMYFAWLQ